MDAEEKQTGIERIRAAFAKGRPAFMPYSVLGYPSRDGGLETVRQLVAAGADILELGIPFSDPLADGPTIQVATQKSLENGTTLRDCIQMTRELRAEGIDTPGVLMGYVNPMMAYGLEKFVADAAEAGVDGLIVPDLPPEESAELEAICAKHGLAFITFLAPTSTDQRIKLVTERANGFIYVVSLTGVTGEKSSVSNSLSDFIGRVRTVTDTPLAVGFGISNGEQAAEVAQFADGIIVGSALVKRAADSAESLRELADELRGALN